MESQRQAKNLSPPLGNSCVMVRLPLCPKFKKANREPGPLLLKSQVLQWILRDFHVLFTSPTSPKYHNLLFLHRFPIYESQKKKENKNLSDLKFIKNTHRILLRGILLYILSLKCIQKPPKNLIWFKIYKCLT